MNGGLKVTCHRCAKPTARRSRRCAHCGTDLKASNQRVGHEAVRCPTCIAHAHLVQLGPLTIDLCGICGGVWFDKDELAQLPGALDEAELRETATAVLAKVRLASAAARTAKYLPCPVCNARMPKHNHLQTSGIVVDRCMEHGAWVEQKDVIRLLDLLEGDTLSMLSERAQSQAHDDLKRRLQSLESAQRSLDGRTETLQRRQTWMFVLDLFGIF
jgi:Zn-finger nucleic acid-binding protein